MIKNAGWSRKNGFHSNDHGYYDEEEDNDYYYDEEDEDSDEVEHWAFCINRDEYAFQAVNCRWCGNYSEDYSPPWLSQNILCSC